MPSHRHFITLSDGRRLHHDPFLPDLVPFPTITSHTSGRWSSPAVWDQGRVPNRDDLVLIANGTDVQLDQDANVWRIKIEKGGAFRFQTDRSVSLLVELIQSIEGNLEIGSLDPGILHNVSIWDIPWDLDEDPGQYGHGILCIGGRSILRGAPKTEWTWQAGVAAAGDHFVILPQTPMGWQFGDKIIFTDTRQLTKSMSYWTAPEWEVGYVDHIVERASSEPGSTKVYLQSPLLYNHIPGRDEDNGELFYPFVMNLTRNTTIRSENPNGVRGHTMCLDRAYVDWQHVNFTELGRTTIDLLNSTTFDAEGEPTHVGTNPKARYSIHFHNLIGPRGDDPKPGGSYQFLLQGCAVDTAPKWAGSFHNTHHGLVHRNVGYNCNGAIWVVEQGNETGNRFIENAGAVCFGTGMSGDRAADQVDFGHSGDIWWIAGLGNYFEGNVGANAFSDFINLYTYNHGELDPTPLFQGADTSVEGEYDLSVSRRDIPMLSFRNNTGYACGNGVHYWMVHSGKDFWEEGTVLWHIQNWYHPTSYGGGLNMRDFKFIGGGSDYYSDPDYRPHGFAKEINQFLLENGRVIGLYVGFGVGGAQVTVNGGVFKNNFDVSTYMFNRGGIAPGIQEVTQEFNCSLLGNVKVYKDGLLSAPHTDSAVVVTLPFDPRTDVFLLEKTFVSINAGRLQIFYYHQHPDYVVDARVSPDPGKTNAELLAAGFGCLSGELASCTMQMEGYHGYVCSHTP